MNNEKTTMLLYYKKSVTTLYCNDMYGLCNSDKPASTDRTKV